LPFCVLVIRRGTMNSRVLSYTYPKFWRQGDSKPVTGKTYNSPGSNIIYESTEWLHTDLHLFRRTLLSACFQLRLASAR